MIDIEPVLKINNVTKKFGKKTVIDNISFEVNPGEVYGFLGPNGAGKTTLIKMVMGLLKITDGNITINNKDITKNYEQAAMNFGGIIENPEMYADLSGITNLKIFSNLYDNVDEEKINKLIGIVGLKGREKEPIKKYSLGMRQRLGLAQALVHDPKLLILDEPTNGLDPKGIKELRNILRKLASKGVAVLVSSHLLSEMELMCDRVCIIDHGKMIEVKDLTKKDDDKNENKEVLHTYIYDTNNDEIAYKIASENYYKVELIDSELNVECSKEKIASLNKLLINNDIDIYTVATKVKSLEDMFLETTSKKSQKGGETI